MFRAFHEKRKNDEGFTLIELLVVILIIAILAAIAIPVFLRQREKGWKSQQESALKNAATAAESYATSNNGGYTGLDTSALTSNGYSQSSGVTITMGTVTANDYCIVATHAQLGNTTAATDWGVASYDSDEGAPEPDDNCTA
jgi:type IV pilus assembly protein PilA